MAQHDYDIANQSGSAFRADLNNALAAIVSDNSGSSAPTPTFAYQTWIDSSTNPATIKRRDASNANWVTVGTVDGAGSATAPGFAVGSGTTYKPGIYSPGTDQLALATGGSGRLFVDSSGNVGIGATPTSLFSVRGNTPAINIDDVSNTSSKIVFRPAVLSYAERGGLSINYSSGEQRLFAGASGTGYFQTFYTDSSERLRITSTGALNFVGAGTAGSTQAVSFNGSAPVNSLVIDSSGRCGIGTSSVQSLLNISSTNPVFTFTRNNNTNASGAINFAGTDNIVKWQIGTNQSTGVGFEINRGDSTNNALYIDTSNRVGIGTTSPGETLHITGNLRMPNTGAINITSPWGDIRKIIEFSSKVLIFSIADRKQQVRAAIEEGAEALVAKSQGMDELFECINLVANGIKVNTSETVAAIDTDQEFKAKLTDRELEVLRMYASGLTLKQVAYELKLSKYTVKEHIDRVREKYSKAGRPAPGKPELLIRLLEDGLMGEDLL